MAAQLLLVPCSHRLPEQPVIAFGPGAIEAVGSIDSGWDGVHEALIEPYTVFVDFIAGSLPSGHGKACRGPPFR
jgi:hypothetical protein